MTTEWDAMDADLWAAIVDAGMTRKVRVKPSGRPTVDVDVTWKEPDSVRFDQSVSKEYSIEYQYSDLPTLAMDDPVTLLDADGEVIAKSKFKVREAPRVSDNPNGSQTGYFRHALLTKL